MTLLLHLFICYVLTIIAFAAFLVTTFINIIVVIIIFILIVFVVLFLTLVLILPEIKLCFRRSSAVYDKKIYEPSWIFVILRNVPFADEVLEDLICCLGIAFKRTYSGGHVGNNSLGPWWFFS
ncbi:uncharacterized protein EI97DRAFT_441363 [Westerdykella ornata]|uniref:Uncharacterized protein n=1 Tax=Westerdykella ornata TaxID=318751 RepID=A0A6A6JQQ0_WESOR|nr:uncharacterized protein EI97DRAFT_441363 [Westerdykella ornata]KAF2277289.1 hypothetical protein EI97DRAFT_441363 [Westerdykella ornata]